MFRKRTSGLVAQLTLLSLTGWSLAAGATPKAAETIIEWNQVAQRYTSGPPFGQARVHAMVHVAMADAVIAIHGKYEPFLVNLQAPPGANARAAAAQAAHDVLVALMPQNAVIYDAALQNSLAAIPPSERWPGRSIGKRTAARVLASRQFDGYAEANPQPPLILPSTLPGIWRPTASGPAAFSAIGNMRPFALPTPTLYLPAPPPQLESSDYAKDYNEVLLLGSATSGARTAHQTRMAQLVAAAPGQYASSTHPLRIWHNVATDVVTRRKLSMVDTARLFALLSVSVHDSLQTSQTSKFIYRLWRPETAVADAANDGNDATATDPSWQPLLVTPPYPSHSSNVACIGGGASRMLANVLGSDDIPFRATWVIDGDTPTVVHTQHYQRFSDFAWDFGYSRVWGGIHYSFEIEASMDSCTQVADYVFDHHMQRARRM